MSALSKWWSNVWQRRYHYRAEPQAYFASAESQEHYVPCPEDYPVFPPPPLKLPFKIQNSTGQKSQQGSLQLLRASSKIHHCTHFTDCMNSSSLTMFSPTTAPWKPFGESIYGPLRIFLIRMMTTQRGPPFLRVALIFWSDHLIKELRSASAEICDP